MATVIDSLLIELGLDASQFDASQKKSVEELRKFDEQSSRTFKNNQRNLNEFSLTANKALMSLTALGVGLISLNGIRNFAESITNTNADIGRTADLFSMSGKELAAWQQTIKKVGGTADDFTNSIHAIQQGLAGIPFGNSAILEPLAMLGASDAVDVKNATVNVLKLSEAIKKYISLRGERGEREAFALTQQMGMSRNMFMLMIDPKTEEFYKDSLKHTGITEKSISEAQKNQEAMARVSTELELVRNKIGDQLLPVMTRLEQAIVRVADFLDKWFGETKFPESPEAAWNTAADAIDKARADLRREGEIKSDIEKTEREKKSQETSDKVFGLVAGKAPFKEKAQRLMDYFTSQGLDKTHAAAILGNFMAESTLNPKATNTAGGKFHAGLAQLGPEERAAFEKFAGFSVMDPRATDMVQAAFMLHRLKTDKIGRSFFNAKTLEGATQAIYSDYERPGSEDTSLGKRLSYSRAFLNQNMPIGASANVPTSNGNNTTNVKTDIGSINIQTQSTDGKGVVRAFQESINNNQLINSGLAGAH